MTEPPNTEALLAALRSDLSNLDPAVHGEDLKAATQHALDDLDAIASELKETQEAGDVMFVELERVRAERDEARRNAEEDRRRGSEQLDRAVEALRVIADTLDADRAYGGLVHDARAALAEIEESG